MHKAVYSLITNKQAAFLFSIKYTSVPYLASFSTNITPGCIVNAFEREDGEHRWFLGWEDEQKRQIMRIISAEAIKCK